MKPIKYGRQKSKFNPDSEELEKATSEFLKSGGKVKGLEEEKRCYIGAGSVSWFSRFQTRVPRNIKYWGLGNG